MNNIILCFLICHRKQLRIYADTFHSNVHMVKRFGAACLSAAWHCCIFKYIVLAAPLPTSTFAVSPHTAAITMPNHPCVFEPWL